MMRSLRVLVAALLVTSSIMAALPSFTSAQFDETVPAEYDLRVNYVDPALMFQTLEIKYGPIFSFGRDTRQIRFDASGSTADSVMATMRRYDQMGTMTLSYPLRYLVVDDGKELVTKQFSPPFVIGDKVNNSLIVGATGDVHLRITILLSQIDRDYNSYRDEVATADPPLRTRVYWLKNMPAARASDYIREHYVKIHRLYSVTADTEKNAVIVTSAPRVLDLITGVFQEIDIPEKEGLARVQTVTFPVMYRPLAEAARIIKASFRPDVIDQSENNRTLVITANSAAIENIRAFLSKYDFQPPTILVEGTILVVNHTKLRQLGTELSSAVTRSDGTIAPRNTRSTRANLTADLLTPTDIPTFNYQFTSGTGKVYTVSLGTLITEGAVEIVHKPHITFLSGGDGSFEATDNIPQLTTSQTGTNVTFVKTGLSLKVSGIAVPGDTVDNDGNVPYKIVLNKLRLTDGQTGTPTTSGTNITQSFSEQIFESPQIVDDGQLILIGGAVNEDRTTTYRRFPILGAIPIIKNLFRSEQTEQRKLERLALLRISVMKPQGYAYKASQFVLSKPQQPIELGGKVNDSIFEHPLKTADWSSQILYRPGGGYFELVHDKFSADKLKTLERAFKRLVRARIPLVQEWSNLELVRSLIMNDSGLVSVLRSISKDHGITIEQFLLIARHTGTMSDPVYLIYVDFCRKNKLFSAAFTTAPVTRESRELPKEPFILKE